MNNKLIIWDWNGTLLNDVDQCIESKNIMLNSRNLKQIDKKRYRSIFTFPVIEYYEKLGFDFKKEPFSELATEYIKIYIEKSKKSQLFDGVIEVLDFFNKNKFSQIILSAMEQGSLEQQTKDKKINSYFKNIIGLDNIHAKSKVDNAINFFKNNPQYDPDNSILIGDTYHDYEVAKELKCKCILINNGHQDLNLFEFNSAVKIIENIIKLKEKITDFPG